MITRARVDGRKFLRYYLITRRRVSSRGGNYMTKTCTFFGHKDTPETVKNGLHTTIEKLITEYGVETFYVGNQGAFDFHTRAALRQLQEKYPYIRYAVVLAYMPGEVSEYEDHSNTMVPEGIEAVHPKYAIDWRNRWMLRESQYVICYIHHHWGGAAKYVQTAQRQGKTVINLCTNNVLGGGGLK